MTCIFLNNSKRTDNHWSGKTAKIWADIVQVGHASIDSALIQAKPVRQMSWLALISLFQPSGLHFLRERWQNTFCCKLKWGKNCLFQKRKVLISPYHVYWTGGLKTARIKYLKKKCNFTLKLAQLQHLCSGLLVMGLLGWAARTMTTSFMFYKTFCRVQVLFSYCPQSYEWPHTSFGWLENSRCSP